MKLKKMILKVHQKRMKIKLILKTKANLNKKKAIILKQNQVHI